MANRYILAQYDQENKIILSPIELRVRHGDTVTWISRLDANEIYVAGNFAGKEQLFPQDEYQMLGMGQSSFAPVIAETAEPIAWTYTCSEELSSKDVSDGDSGQGIIIVDPPPIDDGKEHESGVREEITAGVR